MSELNRATILGTGTMGPGMGAVLARAGLQVTLFDVNPEALERAKAMVGVVEGVLDRLEVPVTRRRRPRLRAPIRRQRSTGAEIVARGDPRAARAQAARCSRRSRVRSRAETIIASNTSGIPITKIWPRACSTPSG